MPTVFITTRLPQPATQGKHAVIPILPELLVHNLRDLVAVPLQRVEGVLHCLVDGLLYIFTHLLYLVCTPAALQKRTWRHSHIEHKDSEHAKLPVQVPVQNGTSQHFSSSGPNHPWKTI